MSFSLYAAALWPVAQASIYGESNLNHTCQLGKLDFMASRLSRLMGSMQSLITCLARPKPIISP